jgi:hypothetical protein
MRYIGWVTHTDRHVAASERVARFAPRTGLHSYSRALAVTVLVACSATSQTAGTGPESTDSGVADVSSPGADGGSPQDAFAANPDVGMPTVLPCSELGPVDVWQNVTPPVNTLGNPPSGSFFVMGGLAVDPRNPGTVYAGNSSYPGYSPNAFWKSTDCGAHWASVATGRNGAALTGGAIFLITVDPVTSDIYTSAFYGNGNLYKSTNGGVDWDDVTPPSSSGFPGFINNTWSLDPMDHSHLVVNFHDNCTAPQVSQCLAQTFDGAQTWSGVAGPQPDAGWGEGVGPTVVGSTILYNAQFNGLYRYTGPTTPWKELLGYAGCFPQRGEIVQIGSTYYLPCYSGLDVETSQDLETWTELANSPQAAELGVTDKYLYADAVGGMSPNPVWRAPLDDLTAWENVTALTLNLPNGETDGGGFAYDGAHHVLYVTSWAGGLWRVAE